MHFKKIMEVVTFITLNLENVFPSFEHLTFCHIIEYSHIIKTTWTRRKSPRQNTLHNTDLYMLLMHHCCSIWSHHKHMSFQRKIFFDQANSFWRSWTYIKWMFMLLYHSNCYKISSWTWILNLGSNHKTITFLRNQRCSRNLFVNLLVLKLILLDGGCSVLSAEKLCSGFLGIKYKEAVPKHKAITLDNRNLKKYAFYPKSCFSLYSMYNLCNI